MEGGQNVQKMKNRIEMEKKGSKLKEKEIGGERRSKKLIGIQEISTKSKKIPSGFGSKNQREKGIKSGNEEQGARRLEGGG